MINFKIDYLLIFINKLILSLILIIKHYLLEVFYNNYEEVFYMIKKKEQEDFPTIIAFTAVIAAMVIPQIPQID